MSCPATADNAAVGVAGPSSASVQKVIQLLADMDASSKKAKKEEEIAFAKFSTWCSERSSQLESEIKVDGEEIETLSASVGKLESDSAALGREVGDLSASVTKMEAEAKNATAQREKDHAVFLSESQDYAESVDALDRAIAVMQKQSYDRAASTAALLQLSDSASVPVGVRSKVAAFVAMMGDDDVDASGTADFMSRRAPDANIYEFQSGGIVGLLKRLRGEFAAKAGERAKEEMNSKHAYEMILQDLTSSVAAAKRDSEEKSALMHSKMEQAAIDKKQLVSTKTVKTENEKTLASMQTECKEKNLSYEEKQRLRAEEIRAIQKAIEILSSAEVMGASDKHFSLTQVQRRATSLLTLSDSGSSGDSNHGVHLRVREFIAREGQRLHSKVLGLLAEQLETDPFAKVKKLIDGLITRLMEEANEDAKHEGFCDAEVGKSKLTRTKLSEQIDSLSAAIESGKAQIGMLSQESSELSKDMANLRASMSEATETRVAEKAENEATVKDAEAASAAVATATVVLKDFYGKATGATAFLQGQAQGVPMGSEEWKALGDPDLEGTVDKGHKTGMQTFGATYTGQQTAVGGVLALLEVIASDFALLKADTEGAEAAAQEMYESFMAEAKKNLAVKEKKVQMNKADQTEAEAKLQMDTKDLKSTQDQLLAAERYWETLEPQCIDQGVSFEERAKARQEEIKSLKEALQILSGDDLPTSAL